MTRQHSKILNLPIKLENGIVTVKDLKKFGIRGYVEYSREEINILRESGGITPGVHLVKSLFDGVIVREAT